MVRALEMIVFAIAEIGKTHFRDLILRISEGKTKLHVLAGRILLLEIPLALLSPTESDRALGNDDVAARLVIGERLPFRVVRFAERANKSEARRKRSGT